MQTAMQNEMSGEERSREFLFGGPPREGSRVGAREIRIPPQASAAAVWSVGRLNRSVINAVR